MYSIYLLCKNSSVSTTIQKGQVYLSRYLFHSIRECKRGVQIQSKRYKIQRRSISSKNTISGTLLDEDITTLVAIVGRNHVLLPSDDNFENYTTDWTKSYRGGGIVVLPSSTEEVSTILRYCNSRRIGVVPQGGNTGLCGGAVGRDASEVVLSLRRLNRVISVDEDAMAVVCEAGCILQEIQDAVAEKGFVVPLDLGTDVYEIPLWYIFVTISTI